jgi:hypothetical protein
VNSIFTNLMTQAMVIETRLVKKMKKSMKRFENQKIKKPSNAFMSKDEIDKYYLNNRPSRIGSKKPSMTVKVHRDPK